MMLIIRKNGSHIDQFYPKSGHFRGNGFSNFHPVADRAAGSPYKSMQVVFYQRVTGMGVTNKYLQVNADLVNPIAIAGVRCVHFFWNLDVPGHVSGNLKLL